MEYDIESILEKYEDDYNPDPRPMVQEPRNNYVLGGPIVKNLASKIFKPKLKPKTQLDVLEPTTVKPSILRREASPLDLNQINSISKNKEFEQAWKNYKISIRKVGRRKYDKDQFFEMWARENMAEGGRTGYYQGGPSETIQPEYDYDSADIGPGGYPLTAKVLSKAVLPEGLKPAREYVIGLLNKIKPYEGSTKGIGVSTPKADRTPEKNFMKGFSDYVNTFMKGNFSSGTRSIGQNRNKIKAIFDRTGSEPGARTSGESLSSGQRNQPIIPKSENAISFTETTTNMKRNPDFYKKLKEKNKYLDQESLAHYLGMGFETGADGLRTKLGKTQYDSFGNSLRNLKVKNKATLGRVNSPDYSVNDAIKKMLEGSKNKLIKGQRVNKLQARNERELDPELFQFRNTLRNRVATLSKNEDIFLPNAIDDVGHPFSLTRSTKFKNLFKNSNINKLNTLVYQDKFLNQDLFKLTGYEAKYVNMFKDLEKLRNKPVTKETQKKLLEIKNKMNNNYNYIVGIVSDPRKVKYLINKKEKRINDSYAKYISGQTDRIQKIDINIPKIGEKFQSQDLFVDMSKVNPNYIMGYVDKINPTARTLKDLSMSERTIFEANARSQNADIVADFYNKAKFAKEGVEEVREKIAYDYAEGGRISRQGYNDGLLVKGLKGSGRFLAQAANPLELVRPRNLIGRAAIAFELGFETVAALDDIYRKNIPSDVAFANKFLLQYLDLNNEEKEAKRILEDKGSNLSPAAKKYAQNIVDKGKLKNLNKFLKRYEKGAGKSESFKNVLAKTKKEAEDLDVKINTSAKVGKGETQAGKFEYKNIIDERGYREEQSEYIGKPKKDSVFTYAADDESKDGFYRNADGNRIKVNEYGYATKGNIFDIPSKTGARVDRKFPYGETDQGRNPALLTEGEKIFSAETKQPAKYQKPFTYKDFNYQNKALSDEQYNKILKYYQDEELIEPGLKLEDKIIPKGQNIRIVNGKEYDPPKNSLEDITDFFNIDEKWNQLINAPGIKGTQDSFATGGLAGLMKKYYD